MVKKMCKIMMFCQFYIYFTYINTFPTSTKKMLKNGKIVHSLTVFRILNFLVDESSSLDIVCVVVVVVLFIICNRSFDVGTS